MKIIENDYYLLYLIKEKNEVAINVMIEKYRALIYRVIMDQNIPRSYFDDFYQEGLLCLFQTIDLFDERFGKTFTRFFELLLRRRLITVRPQIIGNYELIPDFESFLGDSSDIIKETIVSYQIDENLGNMTEDEQKVYVLYFVKNYSIDAIYQKTNFSKKRIYNLICKIKTLIHP